VFVPAREVLNLVERGIRASNARGCFDVPIAEWNVAMMVNMARNLRQMIRNQDGQVWDRDARFQSEIRGLTAGIWGYGGIGRETARLLRSLGMRIHVLSRNGVGKAENVYCVPGTGDPDGVFPHSVFLKGQELEFLSGLELLTVGAVFEQNAATVVHEGLRQELRSAAVRLIEAGIARM
jgi:hypothetical protein